MITCVTCKILLPYESFSRKANSKLGYSTKCKKCHNEYVRTVWYPKNKEKQKNSSKLWKTKNQDRVLATRYRVDEFTLKDLKNKANNRCEVCFSTENLRIDHCHKTGTVRGLLCNSCNVCLGFVKDDIERLKALITYLSREAKVSEPDS